MYRNFYYDPRKSGNFWTTHGMVPFISLWVRIYKLTSYPPGLWPHCATPWVRSSKEFYWNMTGTWPFIRPTSNLWSGRPSKRSSVRLPKAKLTTSLPRSLRKKRINRHEICIHKAFRWEVFYLGISLCMQIGNQ